MADLILITGGSRSGKSRYALSLGEELNPSPDQSPGPERIFLATCPRLDDEMEQRIHRHVEERRPGGWRTHEEQVDLAGALARIGGDVVVVDCLTLWISNLMFHADGVPEATDPAGVVDNGLSESDVVCHCEQLIAAIRVRSGSVISVTNEVGLGIVPDNALARRYRDLVGRCNQTMAAAADSVTLMVSGLPVKIK
jgi:adenosylcobinamide kinase / adenosylcobinamide-phosphate guanylyltransferase